MTFSNFSLAAQQKFFQTSIISIISTLSKLIIIIALYLVNILNIFSATLAFTFSNFIAYIFSIKFLPFTFISSKQEKGDLKKLLSFSAFLGVSKIFSATASKVDALMLIPLSNSYEAGIYSGAYKIAFLYFLLSGSFSSVIAPRLSAFNTYKQASGYLKKTILFVILIILSMIILYIIAPWFIPFILGHNYNESVPVFRLLLFPMALFVLIIPPVNLLIYTYKKPQISTFNTFVQFLLIIIGNTYFIPKYFRYGPIISLSLAYGFTLTSASIFAIYYSKKYK
jgi:O-antigen/teichoic acid export membrane protein